MSTNLTLKEINVILINSRKAQIQNCEAAVDFLIHRMNEIMADSGFNRRLKRNLVENIKTKINLINKEIVNHMGKINKLSRGLQ